MNNVIDAVNVLVNGVNLAYSRGAYSMKETHDLHEAIEFIKQAVSSQQEKKETAPAPVNAPNTTAQENKNSSQKSY